MMESVQALVIVLSLALGTYAWVRTRRLSIEYIPGPHASSFVLGNLVDFFTYEGGKVDADWTRTYGDVVRFKGMFGSDRLLFSDPKSMQHICQNAGTDYLKPTIRREVGRMFLGRGIAYSQGANHKKHRKILSPAFGTAEMRTLMPAFRVVTRRMCERWEDELQNGEAVIDVCGWLSRATLDIIGEVAFEYHFDTLINNSNKLARAYNNFLVSAFGIPNTARVLVQQLVAYLPPAAFALLDKLPSHSLKTLRAVAQEGAVAGREMLERKRRSGESEKGKRDVLSLLVQANESESPAVRLTDEELISQIRTIMAAGHETTSNTISFLLYELARHPEMQEKVRNEIEDALAVARAKGQAELSMNDMDKMEYGLAFMKEVLRLYPVVYQTWLQAARDDVIPISKPIRGTDGRLISEIAVGKGQDVHLSIIAYNRLEIIFGSDTDQLVPERWLDPEKPILSPFGVYSNLGNFISGSQACLGFKFATIELQTFMVEILRHFRLAVVADGRKIVPAAAGVLAPVVDGELGKGKQLPLMVSML